MTDAGHAYASVWQRLAAALLDGLVLFIPTRVVGWVGGRAGLATVVALTYFIVLTALTGQTVGKRLVGLRVTRTDGSKPDFASAALREVLGKFLSGVATIGIGYLWALVDERGQALHDKLGDTVVVRTGAAGAKPVLEAPREVAAVAEQVREHVGRTVRRVTQAPATRPSTARADEATGTLTILFADVHNAAGLTERLGDIASRDALRGFASAMRDCVAAGEGRVVKTTGDGVMATFRSSRRAVQCALNARGRLAGTAVHVTMGLHAGEVITDGPDVHGKNVVIASRIASTARAGEILVSSVVKTLVEDTGEFRFGEARQTELKELAGTYVVHEVLAPGQ